MFKVGDKVKNTAILNITRDGSEIIPVGVEGVVIAVEPNPGVDGIWFGFDVDFPGYHGNFPCAVGELEKVE